MPHGMPKVGETNEVARYLREYLNYESSVSPLRVLAQQGARDREVHKVFHVLGAYM